MKRLTLYDVHMWLIQCHIYTILASPPADAGKQCECAVFPWPGVGFGAPLSSFTTDTLIVLKHSAVGWLNAALASVCIVAQTC